MADKIALVTGANKSIGLEVTRELARRGMVVYLGSRDEQRGRAAAEAPEQIRLTLETNVHGPARLQQLATPLLRQSKAGRVVNVSSGAGRFAYLADPKTPKPCAYCLSKAAINGMTVMFAEALRADGIKVNAANPGYVHSAVSFFQGHAHAARGRPGHRPPGHPGRRRPDRRLLRRTGSAVVVGRFYMRQAEPGSVSV